MFGCLILNRYSFVWHAAKGGADIRPDFNWDKQPKTRRALSALARCAPLYELVEELFACFRRRGHRLASLRQKSLKLLKLFGICPARKICGIPAACDKYREAQSRQKCSDTFKRNR